WPHGGSGAYPGADDKSRPVACPWGSGRSHITATEPTMAFAAPPSFIRSQIPINAAKTVLLRENLVTQKVGEEIPHHHRESHSQALRPLGDERLLQALIAIPPGHPVRDNRRREPR